MFATIHHPYQHQAARLCIALTYAETVKWLGTDEVFGTRINLSGDATKTLTLEVNQNGNLGLQRIPYRGKIVQPEDRFAAALITHRKVNAYGNSVSWSSLPIEIVAHEPIVFSLPEAYHGNGEAYVRTRTKRTPPMPLFPTETTPAEEKLDMVLRISKKHGMTVDEAIKLLPILKKLEAV